MRVSRATLVAALAVLALALADLPSSGAAAADAPAADVPGIGHVGLDGIADPHVVRVGDVWFAFATSHGDVNVPVAMSADLHTWTLAADALPAATFPAWAEGPVWAPGAIDAGGRWLLFFSAGWRGDWRRCIGVAVADWPAGPYRAATDRPLTCGATTEAWGAIDPLPYRDGTGQLYLAWKDTVSARQLWAAPLTPDGLAVASAPRHLLDGEPGWEDEGIENPAMVEAAGAWWLVYSGGWWTDGRSAVGYARCDGPLGPCTKVTRDAPWLATRPGLIGPGGATFTTGPTGEPWMVLHAWDPARPSLDAGGARQLRAHPVRFTVTGPRLGSRPPVGVLEQARHEPGGLRLGGWAVDPDSPAQPVAVAVAVDGVVVGTVPADRPRPELAAFLGAPGAAIGFEVVVGLPAGARTVCAEAVGSAPGDPFPLGCADLR
ncbi:MAG: family 43 glycosylhydrolase [Acidimicrobiales bacterium]|nr:family 43 glycosylhydrolase [Acidimicrobiales bacterium]